MKTRIITALLIILCVVPPLVFGGWMIDLLIAFIIIAGGLELLSLKEQETSWPIGIKALAIAAVGLLVVSDVRLYTALLGVLALVFLSIPVFTERFHAKDAFLCIAYITFFSAIASCFLHIYETNRLYVWYIIIATYACDTAAYFCGRFLGKHKLNERISPKKTWEGSIGGWIFGTLCSMLFAWYMIDGISFLTMTMISAILTITAQIGDLAFSAIKRKFGIKDFSDFLPGHGGVLDRVDSLVFNFICFDFILVVLTL